MTKYVAAASLFTALMTSPLAWGHGESHEKKAERKPVHLQEETAFGRPGDPKKVNRTITVDMTDNMHFSSGQIRVRQGETIKFIVRNRGKAMHEMVIGTMKELREHAELMRKFPNMEHDEPYMAHVAPGKTETILWQFTKAGEFHYACLVAGHFEAGMVAGIRVQPAENRQLADQAPGNKGS